ncbi:MAG: caspase family protein [Spirochaetales bacterium]|nr:caspase family protein [Spirochaetales bacterium]
MKKTILLFLTTLLIILIPVHTWSQTGPAANNQEPAGCNTKSVFENVIPQKTTVFLVGNNLYRPGSGYDVLTQSHNDTILIREILAECCKADREKIRLYEDLTLGEFKEAFEKFRNTFTEDEIVIVYYSGHGESNGSLVFTDGGTLPAQQLKDLVNSFTNDTVLIIDACYSGNNEGPAEFGPDEVPYRDNCIRIYASLAHLLAKEITYDNPFFSVVLPFYRDVLHLNNIDGNGYFTALIGMFFAQYRFQKEENVSYQDIVYSVTNKAKVYVETLAKTKGTEQKGAWEEAVYRLNQLPKIHPADRKISFQNENHAFMILQKEKIQYRPENNHISLTYDATATITLPPYDKSLGIGAMPMVSVMYNIPIGWGILGFGILAGTQWTTTNQGSSYPYNLLMYPLALHTRYCSNLESPFYFILDLSAGAGIVQLLFVNPSDFPKNSTDFKFYWNMSLGFGVNISKYWGITASIGYTQLHPHADIYHFLAPGISVIHNLTGTQNTIKEEFHENKN